MNISMKTGQVKKFISLFCTAILSFGVLLPTAASAHGLGSAGSLTIEGLVIGLAILGVIFLVFLGLLLVSRANELMDIEAENHGQSPKTNSLDSNDILNLNQKEISELIHNRRLRTNHQK